MMSRGTNNLCSTPLSEVYTIKIVVTTFKKDRRGDPLGLLT